MLANILLDDFDRELEKRGHRFARYADDVLVLVRSQRAGQRVKASLTKYLARQLKLPVNEQKSRVAPIDECVFLGFTFRKGKLRWSDAAFDDFKHRIRKLTGEAGESLDGDAIYQACAVRTRLDGLFWHLAILSSDP